MEEETRLGKSPEKIACRGGFILLLLFFKDIKYSLPKSALRYPDFSKILQLLCCLSVNIVLVGKNGLKLHSKPFDDCL